MSKKLHLLATGASLALALSLSGCGGSSTPAASTTTVSGTAMAGPFLSGQACAYKVVNGAKDALLGTCANLASSAFSIDVGSYTGDVLIEIGAGATYDDEANPNDNVTGTVLTGSLRSLINVGTVGGTVSLAVTPLTETAIRMAAALNDTSVQAALTQVAALLPTVSGLDLRTTLPAATTNLGLAYQQMLRALSQMQWVAGGNGVYTGGLDAYLTSLAGQIGTNGNTVGADLLGQIGSGLSSNCSVTNGALSCTVSTGGGGGGGGGGIGGITCNTSLFQPGSVQTPTSTELASYARTYTGSEGSYDMITFAFTASGSATLVFNADGSATYNSAAYAPTSYCLENLSGGGQQLVIHGPGNSHFDLRSNGTWNGMAPSGSVVNDTPYTAGGSGATTAVISGITPSTGPEGTAVYINGSNLNSFTPSPTVKFGTTPAAVTSFSYMGGVQITVNVPAGLSAGNHVITVANGDGSGSVTAGTFNVTSTGSGGGAGTGLTLSTSIGGITTLANETVAFADDPTSNPLVITRKKGSWGNALSSVNLVLSYVHMTSPLDNTPFESLVLGLAKASPMTSSEFNVNGGTCVLSGTYPLPSCSSLGVSFDKTTGLVSFTGTSLKTLIGSAGIYTIDGSLSFTPF